MARKAGLGRGLSALLGDVDVSSLAEAPAGAELVELALSDIHPNDEQPRRDFDQDELQELADSIARNGLLQPIVVREHGGAYQIVAGERRWRAAGMAGLSVVPAVVRAVDDADVLALALVENLQRSDLGPLEAARGYRALMDSRDLTQDEVAQLVSKSRPAIANALRLLDLPERVQDLLASGELTAGHARAILSVEGDEARCALAERVVRERLSVRQTEMLASGFSVTPRPATRETPSETYREAQERLAERLGTKVRVRSVRGKARIEIEFADEEELAQLVETIGQGRIGEGVSR